MSEAQAAASVPTVTVTRKGKRFTLTFSKLQGQTFGPYEFAEAVRDLRVSALLAPLAARDLVLDAHAQGSATAPTG
jgi:hypothetical protein